MKILIIDTVNDVLIETLRLNGFNCVYEPDFKEPEIQKCIADYEGLVLRNKVFSTKILIENAPKLKFIGWISANIEPIDIEYTAKRGIVCFHAAEGICDAVGEHTLAMLLNLFNHLCRSNMQVKNGIWKRDTNKGIEIGGKTIGIIGYGLSGKAFAKRLQGFGAKVLAYDKFLNNFSDDYVTETDMDTIFADCDVVSYHIPFCKETHYLVDYHYLKKFRKNVYLINTAHGKLINTDDLAKAIEKGKVLGAALDVLEFEMTRFEDLHFGDMPESLEYLVDSDNVIFSPHIAGWTEEADYRMAKVLSDKIIETFI